MEGPKVGCGVQIGGVAFIEKATEFGSSSLCYNFDTKEY
jgi:hypothetical protein